MITDAYRDSLDNITLHESIQIPSKVHVYSLGVEYMRDWFLSKFEDNFFKTVYINGKYIFDDYRRFNRTQLVKVEKPAVSIIPNVEYDYNREMVDLNLGGLDVLTRRSRFRQTTIIQDYDNNFFLQMHMELVKINFTFRVRVGSRAKQLDLYNFMKFAFRVGATQKSQVSYDFHLPYEMMLNMAKHNGFEIEYPPEDKKDRLYPRIKNVPKFLSYLNSHSMFPISYKLRTANGNCEFFMRVPDQYTHISNLDPLSLDDGEREGQLDNNFHIEMNCQLLIPAPQEYFFYSSEALDNKFKLQNDIAGLYRFRPLSPPDKDPHGWRQYISTEYQDDSKHVESIELAELLEGTDLERAMNATREMGISPAIFVNIILYNAQYEQRIDIDWENMIIYPVLQDLKMVYSQITIYVDLEYMNNQIKLIDNTEKSRLQ